MPRGSTIQDIYALLQSKVGAQAENTSTKARYYKLIASKQQQLATRYDWPFMEVRFDAAVAANGRYVNFPSVDTQGGTLGLMHERPIRAEVFWTNKWMPLEYGIGSKEFNYLNSDQVGQRMDPIQRWRWSASGQFEVWPMPTTAQTVRFTGQRVLARLTTDGDTADLDDELLALAVAADLLVRAKQPDAGFMLQQYEQRLKEVRAAYPTYPKKVVFGGGCDEDRHTQNRRLIPVAIHGN